MLLALRYAVAFLPLAALAAAVADTQSLPIISLIVSPHVKAEAAQIKYFMTGPFGGYGSYAAAALDPNSYTIPASVNGRAAFNLKIIGYLPGCEIVRLDVSVDRANITRRLPCNPLPTVSLRGRIPPDLIAADRSARVEVSYIAWWASDFFGTRDGLVTTFRVASAIPQPNGKFEVELPDLQRQPKLGQGSFAFLLRNVSSGNILAHLRLSASGADPEYLPVQSTYEELLEFVAKRH